MPRKSAASAAVKPATRPAKVPQAPEDLNAVAQAEWKRLVRAMPAGYFTPEMFGLLSSLCAHVAEERRLTTALDTMAVPTTPADLNFYRDLSRLRDAATSRGSSLATKLRLSPQARYQPNTAGRLASKRRAGEPPPWAQSSKGNW